VSVSKLFESARQLERKFIEIITSVVHVSSFDKTHSSTGSKRNILYPYQLAGSNPCVHWAAMMKLRLYQTVKKKKTQLLSRAQNLK
jgi:hypothetical protein